MASYELLAIIFTGLGLTASITYYSWFLETRTKHDEPNYICKSSPNGKIEPSSKDSTI